MRNLLLALFCAGGLACATAQAANNDVIEFGVGARLLFNGDVYSAKNPGVNYDSDVFPIVGDQAFGLNMGGAIGHRFDSRRGPFEVLIKYYYSTSAEDKATVPVSLPGGGAINVDLTGSLDQHDLLLAFRMPGEFMPLPLLNWSKFYYDLGMGVTTLSYEYEVVGSGVLSDVTRSGMAYNAGIGLRHELTEDMFLNLRADFIMGKIQDIKNSTGQVVHGSPSTHGARLQVGLVRYFKSLF